jgi:hypothetical protein
MTGGGVGIAPVLPGSGFTVNVVTDFYVDDHAEFA